MLLQPGTHILNGKYRIERLLGEGASAEVYLVYQEELGDEQALKVLKREIGGKGSTEITKYRDRFRLEGRLQAQLRRNTRVLQVFGTETFDGLPVLVMEYAEGRSLEDELEDLAKRETRMAWLRCAELLRDVAEGLQGLHARGWVHRDVKPSNILLERPLGRAKIGDLGLAQTEYLSSGRSDGQAGPHSGTQGYLSPEHGEEAAMLPPAADIFSLGISGYRMLTGLWPPPAARGHLAPEIEGNAPEWLKRLIQRMLAWDYRERPQNGGAVAEEIARGLKTEAEREAQRSAWARELRGQIEAALKAGDLDQAAGLVDALSAVSPDAPELPKLGSQVYLAILAETKRVAAAEQKRLADEAARVKREEEERRRVAAAAAAEAKCKAETNQFIRRVSADRLMLVLGQGLEMEFAQVPAGELLYGESKEKQRTEAFWVGRSPVTTAHFLAFIGEAGYKAAHRYYASKVAQQQLNHPAKCVSWDDAQAWCAWASAKANAEIRLPGEVEWEKAARGTNGSEYPWGNAQPTERLANFGKLEAWNKASGEDDWKFTTPVGQFSPAGNSQYGLMDAAGNVWEWCADWYDKEQKSRVLRGGSFDYDARGVRCAYRFGNDPNYRFVYLGFRVILCPPSL